MLSTVPDFESIVPLPTPKVDNFTSESPDNFPRDSWTTSIGMVVDLDWSTHRLKAVHETLVIYTNGASERVLSELDPLQQQLFQALGLGSLAEQLGTTTLPTD